MKRSESRRAPSAVVDLRAPHAVAARLLRGTAGCGLPLLVALLVCGAATAHGQAFFPDGTDWVHYDPRRGPHSRLYVGEITGDADCHYRIDLPPDKTIVKAKALWLRFPNLGGHAAVLRPNGHGAASEHPTLEFRADRTHRHRRGGQEGLA